MWGMGRGEKKRGGWASKISYPTQGKNMISSLLKRLEGGWGTEGGERDGYIKKNSVGIPEGCLHGGVRPK